MTNFHSIRGWILSGKIGILEETAETQEKASESGRQKNNFDLR